MHINFAAGQNFVRASLWAAGLFCLALLLIYEQTTWSMVAIWSRSETFAHGFLIAPISLWLIWNQRELLTDVMSEPALWVVLLLFPVGLAWLLAWLVDVAVVQQLALVAMLVVGCWAILGHQLARILAFPLLFLFFAVPMGENLIAPMMEFTASSTVWMIKMTGIPVYREGLIFSLPTGTWSVVEACSGVRYIIASVTVGVLYAYLTYRSWTRRLLFVLVSAIVPVFANSARAYIIVMLGHMSDMRIATGADHLIYGWVFFGLVIFVLFWLGSFFREDHLPQRTAKTVRTQTRTPASSSARRLLMVVVCAVLAASTARLVAYAIVEDTASQTRAQVNLPGANAGWQPSHSAGWDWSPPSRVSGQESLFYLRESGQSVRLIVQFADGTIEGADIVGSSTLFNQQDDGWLVVMQDKRELNAVGKTYLVDEAKLRGAGGELLVWSWYLMGGASTSNNYHAKLQQIEARLGLAETGAYRIVLSAPVQVSLEHTRSLLQQFADDYISAVYKELRSADEAIR
ncbi:MAG: exosortase A [Halioglobus sp.]